jgi:hypothetical protein
MSSDLISRLRANDPTLTRVDLSNAGITDLSFLKGNTHLRRLVLRNNMYARNKFFNVITDLSPLRECSKLVHLDISGNLLLGYNLPEGTTIGPFNFSRSKKLWCEDMRHICSFTPQTLGEWCPNLRSLYVNHCTSLSLMHNDTYALEYLLEGCNKLNRLDAIRIVTNTSDVFRALRFTPRIRTLYLDENLISSIDFLKYVPLIQILNLFLNLIVSLDVLERFSFPKLVACRLGRNRIHDITPLRNISKRLVSLDISSNPITNIEVIGFMEKLIRVDMHGCNVTDLDSLRLCNHLQTVMISDTLVTDLSPLQHLLDKLVILDCGRTQITLTDEEYVRLSQSIMILNLNLKQTNIPINQVQTIYSNCQLNKLNFTNRRITLFDLVSKSMES